MPLAVNYRGTRVPILLGACFTGFLVLVVGLSTFWSWLVTGHLATEQGTLVWILIGIVAVFAAGLYDDFRPSRTRGLVNQISLAVRGTVTSGVIKMLVIVGASAFVAWMIGARGWRLALGVPVMSGCANLWNLLDVKPGRALKAFIPAVVGVGVAAGGLFSAILAFPSAAGGAVALWLDLLEWAMLGDGGSNVLGFAVGAGLLLSVPTGGLAVALVVILLLHVLAETVTLSRTIEATPPLRWLDRLGRREVPARPSE